jgi:glycosyltransferase involved in cell wall biosynthesis
MHCTNTFPLLSPAVYYAARAERVAVVQSLRNYRLMCANALLMRDGKPCEECLQRTVALPALRHRCYRDSLSATAVLVTMVGVHRAIGTWRRAVDLYFTPSAFARRKFVEAGFDADRIAVKPNFVHPDPGSGAGPRDGAIFVGRLAAEKGLDTLLNAWLVVKERFPQLRLRIIGDGPLAPMVREKCGQSSNIEWLGRLSVNQALEWIGRSSLLITPSVAYETFGRTVIEAFAMGTPVLASDNGAMAELIEPGRTGMLFRAGDAADLAAQVAAMKSAPDLLERMGAAARLEYLEKFTADTNYGMLMQLYRRAIELHGGGGGAHVDDLNASPAVSAVTQAGAEDVRL